jgi:hypothetical protein
MSLSVAFNTTNISLSTTVQKKHTAAAAKHLQMIIRDPEYELIVLSDHL